MQERSRDPGKRHCTGTR